jgi:hypothetical protein
MVLNGGGNRPIFAETLWKINFNYLGVRLGIGQWGLKPEGKIEPTCDPGGPLGPEV